MNDSAHKRSNGLVFVAAATAAQPTGPVDSIECNPYYQRIIEKVLHLASNVFLNSQRSEETDSVIDTLTGLPNAKSAELFFESEWNRARCHKYRFTVLAARINNLEEMLRQGGRAACDRLMLETAETLQTNIQRYEFL